MEKHKPFVYCTLCQHSHTQGYRHLYTNKHRGKVNNACVKMKAKVHSLVSSLQTPVFEKAASFTELQRTIWCYACDEAVHVHACEDGEVVTLNFAAFCHFLCESHKNAAGIFLKENRLLKSEDKLLYWISTDTAERIVSVVNSKRAQFKEQLHLEMKKDCESLRSIEAMQRRTTSVNSTNPPDSGQVKSSEELKSDDIPIVGPSYEDFHQHLKAKKLQNENRLSEKRALNKPGTPESAAVISSARNNKEQTVAWSGQIQPYKRVRKA